MGSSQKKVIVCFKQVPSTEAKIEINEQTRNINTSKVKWIINPYDEYAIEEAVKLKEKKNFHVIGISLGPKTRVIESMRTAFAMGVDEGIIIDKEKEENNYLPTISLDPFIISEALFLIIKNLNPDYVFCGKQTIDAQASCVGAFLAKKLNISYASSISSFSIDEDFSCVVTSDLDKGEQVFLKINPPLLLTTNKGLNSPRFISLPALMKAKRKQAKEISFSSLEIDCNKFSKISYESFCFPEPFKGGQVIEGTLEDQVKEVVSLIKSMKII